MRTLLLTQHVVETNSCEFFDEWDVSLAKKKRSIMVRTVRADDSDQ